MTLRRLALLLVAAPALAGVATPAIGEPAVNDLQENAVPAANQNPRSFFPEEGAGPRILFVGNSLARHGLAPGIGWNRECGMAASGLAHDYVHRTKALVAAEHPDPAVAVLQVADFERAFETYDIPAECAEAIAFRPDVIVMFFGANVPQDYDNAARPFTTTFGDAYARLRDALAAGGHAKVLHVQGWYVRPKLETEKRAVAEARGDAFLELGAEMQDDPALHGIYNHPNDAGMEAIARRIFAAIRDWIAP
jgi:hypothetical protein